MKLRIRDRDALLAVSPAALSAYARVAGWRRQEPYRVHSDVYECTGLPEIIIPRTEHLGDYASVVATLVETFAEVAGQDALTTYRDLVTADRDVIRIRAIDRDHSGSLPVSAGADLVCCARDMVLAAVCSLDNPRPLYRPGANREANEYLQRVRLGQTDRGSFVITLLGPVVSPPVQMSLVPETGPRNDPIERRVTRRLAEALAAARKATDDTNGGEFGRVSCLDEPRGQRQSVRSAGHTDRGTTGTRHQCRMGTDLVTGRNPDRHAIRCSRRPRSA